MGPEERIIEEFRLIEEKFGNASGVIIASEIFDKFNYDPNLLKKFNELATSYHEFLIKAQEELVKHLLNK